MPKEMLSRYFVTVCAIWKCQVDEQLQDSDHIAIRLALSALANQSKFSDELDLATGLLAALIFFSA